MFSMALLFLKMCVCVDHLLVLERQDGPGLILGQASKMTISFDVKVGKNMFDIFVL